MGRIQESRCDFFRYASSDDYGLFGQLRLALQKHVDFTRRLPPLGNRPYDERLATAQIAGGEYAGTGGRVSSCFNVAPGVELDAGLGESPTFFPDGRTLAYGSAGKIRRISIDGGPSTPLIDAQTGAPAVSPDGAVIACTYRATIAARLQVAFYPSTGGQPLRIIDMPRTARLGHLHWGPGGRAVQFVDTRQDVGNLWEVERDTGAISQITHFGSDLIFEFAWSPDGRQLALSRGREASDAVLVTDAGR